MAKNNQLLSFLLSDSEGHRRFIYYTNKILEINNL
jgi:hypothetical protein